MERDGKDGFNIYEDTRTRPSSARGGEERAGEGVLMLGMTVVVWP